MIYRCLLSIALFACLPTHLFADTIELNISESAQRFLKSKLEQFQSTTGHQLAVVTTDANTAYTQAAQGRLAIVNRPALVQERPEQFDSTELGREGALVIVNFHNPISSITMQQVASIFSGQTDHWLSIHKEFDYPMTAYSPRTTADSHFAMIGPLDINPEQLASYVSSEKSDKKMLGYVAIKPGGIGIITQSSFEAGATNRSEYVKVLYVDGIEAKQRFVDSGFYPLSVPVLFVSNRELSSAESELLSFLSP